MACSVPTTRVPAGSRATPCRFGPTRWPKMSTGMVQVTMPGASLVRGWMGVQGICVPIVIVISGWGRSVAFEPSSIVGLRAWPRGVRSLLWLRSPSSMAEAFPSPAAVPVPPAPFRMSESRATCSGSGWLRPRLSPVPFPGRTTGGVVIGAAAGRGADTGGARNSMPASCAVTGGDAFSCTVLVPLPRSMTNASTTTDTSTMMPIFCRPDRGLRPLLT